MKYVAKQVRSMSLATIVGFVSVLFVFDFSNSTHAHPNYDVAPVRIQYQAETKEQLLAWERALDICEPISINAPSFECTEALGRYFLDRPVWDFTDTRFYHGPYGTGLPRLYRGLLPFSTRSFGYDDYAIEQIPLWRDIFDGQFEDRKRRFLRMLSDSVCAEMTNMDTGGIDASMFLQCDAREIYKYAETIDACFRSHQLLVELRATGSFDGYEGITNYEVSFLKVDAHVKDPELQDIAKRRMKRGFLRASWLSSMCANKTFAVVSDTLELLPTETGLFSWYETRISSVRRTYSVALRLAVKAGDEWAIRTYSPTSYESDEFKSDLLRMYPILTHRNLADSYRYNEREEARRHQAKIYILLRELAGAEVADREFDRVELQDEIEYVLKGGELKFYPTRKELDEAREMKAREREENEREWD